MRRIEGGKVEEAKPESLMVERLAANVAYLLEANGWTQQELKGYCMARRVAPRTIDNVIAGKGNPEARTIAVIAGVLGVDEARLLLPADELALYVEEVGLSPLPSPRPSHVRESSQGSGASSQSSRERFRDSKKPGAKERTSPASVSNRRYTLTGADQRRWVRTRAGMYRKGTFRAHRLRPADRGCRVNETSVLNAAS